MAVFWLSPDATNPGKSAVQLMCHNIAVRPEGRQVIGTYYGEAAWAKAQGVWMFELARPMSVCQDIVQ